MLRTLPSSLLRRSGLPRVSLSRTIILSPRTATFSCSSAASSAYPAPSASVISSPSSSISITSPSSILSLSHRSRASRLNRQLLLRSRISVRHCSCARLARQLETEGAMSIPQGREVLPENVKPLHYDIELEPNFETFKFNGKVAIDLDITKDTKEVSVNSLEIEIRDVKLVIGEKTLTPEKKSYNTDTQTDTFTFGETLEKGTKATLKIDYVGELNDKMAGFYRSSYVDKETGETKWLATTQMEPTDARRAAPCFDQPDLKSTWTVTLIADKDLTCLSNMDVKEEKDLGNGKKSVNFNKTPLMSTYLLAFIVGDLRYKETNDFRLPIRVYATPGNEQYADFSLDIAAKTLKFYEETFDVEYPLPKMDMVAIPDFSAGAMENWGLVTYRVVDLLYDPATASIERKQRIAEVVQHELAHQWFGNLVTMDFWEGLWLNEGFATWMSWYSTNKFYPEWKVWDNYVVDNLARALGLDGLRNSHPIEVPVKKVAEINQIFDSISYSKGSSILRMVSKYLGEDVFMKGVSNYLKKHAYGNTQTTDLWAALSEASGKDVEGAMATWTKKIGYPVVTVTEEGNKLHFKQNRYLKTADVKPEEDETLWPIFVALKTKEGINEDISFNTREYTLEIKDTDFYKINADQSNVYRTNYSPERLKKLGEAAKSGLLSVQDRAGMLGDAGALATSGYQKTSALLDLVAGFKEEDSFTVWSEIASSIGSVRGAWLFADEEDREALKAFNREVFGPLAHKLGWDFKDGEDDIVHQLKALAFSSAGLSGDEKVVAAAKELFKKVEAGDWASVDPNIRGAVYGIALQYGENEGEKEYEHVLNVYRNGRNNDEKNVALRWLGRSKNPANIKKTLELALNGEVKDQDIYQPISGLRSHREGTLELWKWFQANYDTLIKKFPPSLNMLGTIVSMCVSNFTTSEQAAEVRKFFEGKELIGFDRALAQSLDSVQAKTAWIERDSQDVKEWLKKRNAAAKL